MTLPSMAFNSKGIRINPLKIFPVNGNFILAVYKGSLSEFDLLIKYRQKDNTTNSGWSKLRTPKHIHWAVDILIKMNMEEGKTKKLLSFLIQYWESNVQPIKSSIEQNELLKSKILVEINSDAENYLELENKGEYSVKFLILMAKLLMFQEKTNYHEAYMFKTLLESLESGEDIFKIVSVATHNRK